jgi:predicted dinucleotide-binding enzyme
MHKENTMRIAIIGAGNMGATLAGLLTRLGHQVAIANSRGPQTLAGIAAQTGAARGCGRHRCRQLRPAAPRRAY